jgi:hypothetical protein
MWCAFDLAFTVLASDTSYYQYQSWLFVWSLGALSFELTQLFGKAAETATSRRLEPSSAMASS